MLLEDFRKNSAKRLRKINKMLGEQYGITISPKVATPKLKSMRQGIVEQVQHLKVEGNVSNSCPELSKYLLVLEGIDELLELKELNETKLAEDNATPYVRVIKWLGEFVAKNALLGDSMDDALDQAMKEYRSSKWRFSDEDVRNDTKKKAMSLLTHRKYDFDAGHSGSDPWSGNLDKTGRNTARAEIGQEKDDHYFNGHKLALESAIKRVEKRLQQQQGK